MNSEESKVEVAETLAAGSEPDGTKASEPAPRVRTGSRTILPVGTEIGRYVLAERIGAGGMGNVYRARDPKLDREIAVKLVAGSLESAQQYLEREAQAMAKLSHPNVCTVHDIGTWNDQLFIAMELCSGSLATWLAESRPWREVVQRFVAAGRGLAAAHRIGLVHRDFKPDNVLVAADGTVKVSDFGLVRSSAGKLSTGSNPDLIEGTPAYMAPEQIEGSDVDARADQFAYAVSVWEGVCGGRPFQPEVGTRDVMQGMLRAIRSRRLMRSTTSEVPKRVLQILERALSPDPGERYPSLDVLVDALERAARPSRKRQVAIALGGAAVIAAVTAITIRVTSPTPDISGKNNEITQAAGAVYRALGDLVVMRRRDDRKYHFNVTDLKIGIAAYDIALQITNDIEIRPRLAGLLYGDRQCSESLAQLDTYRREGGKTATLADFGVHEFNITGESKAIDFDFMLLLREDCDNVDRLPTTGPELAQVAVQLWRVGKFERADVLLQRAYMTDNEPNHIKMIGDMWSSAGKCELARSAYETYLHVAENLPEDWIKNVRETSAACKPAD